MQRESPTLESDRDDMAAKKAKCSGPMDSSPQPVPMELSYIEFYSGVGGWTMALEKAIQHMNGVTFSLRRIAALDHSDLCTKVFEHNFGSSSSACGKSTSIERLTKGQLEEWKATIWVMSPPCQPHTRQHSNQEEDLDDPRSASFLHLVSMIRILETSHLPTLLFLENVVGFESSKSFHRWVEALEYRDYIVLSFHLTPTQIGLPNDRPRYFCVGLKKDRIKEEQSLGSLKSYLSFKASDVLKGIPELGVKFPADFDENDLPTIATFLQDGTDRAALLLPEKSLKGNVGWCLDIISPLNRRTSCFTSAYGRYNRGTGSVLYEDEGREFHLVDPEHREFDEKWSDTLDFSKLRYFSGIEMAGLMGFSEDFSFPPDVGYKQQWKLIGNSLNVRVAAKVIELGFQLMKPEQSAITE